MKATPFGVILVLFVAGSLSAEERAGPIPVEISRQPGKAHIEIRAGGKPFTTFRFDEDLSKPVLFPVYAPSGAVMTRGYPIDPKPGESTDHPHHTGLWMNYGDVAGLDFWGNAGGYGKKPGFFQAAARWLPFGPSPTKGRIEHRRVRAMESGAGTGKLSVSAAWLDPDGDPLVHEATDFVFHASADRRAIDRVAVLSAIGNTVPMPDNKEGFFALRLGPALEESSRKNPAGTGAYHSSEGLEGKAVWGTRAKWVMLTGELAGKPVTVAVLDHPKNPGYPTYWHARGYGLFAANPLGQKALSKGKETLDFRLQPGKPVRFAYRVVILSHAASDSEIEAEHQSFAEASLP